MRADALRPINSLEDDETTPGFSTGRLDAFVFPPPPSAPTSVPRALSTSAAPVPEPQEEFPYVAPKHQQVGHARRVSVATNANANPSGTAGPGDEHASAGREGLDALGLDSTAHGRMPWQTHGTDRGGRRVSFSACL